MRNTGRGDGAPAPEPPLPWSDPDHDVVADVLDAIRQSRKVAKAREVYERMRAEDPLIRTLDEVLVDLPPLSAWQWAYLDEVLWGRGFTLEVRHRPGGPSTAVQHSSLQGMRPRLVTYDEAFGCDCRAYAEYGSCSCPPEPWPDPPASVLSLALASPHLDHDAVRAPSTD